MKVFMCDVLLEEVEYDRYFELSLFPLPMDLHSWQCPLDECIEAVERSSRLW